MFAIVSYPLVVITVYLLRAKQDLKTLHLEKYNYDDSETYLQNLENLIEAYKISAQTDS